MSEKNRDNKNRWRNVTIAFRMSPEENEELDLRVKLCGYQTRQEYIIEKEKAQAEKERDAVIKKTEVLEKRFSALNSKAGLVDSHAREYGYYPEEWLPEAGTLESAKSYRKRIFPLVKKVANMIQALYSKYLDLKNKNQKLSDRNIDLENRVDRLREEISVIKKENVALLNVAYDMDRVVAVLGENKVKEAIEVAKHLEQVNAKQKGKKRRTDREGR